MNKHSIYGFMPHELSRLDLAQRTTRFGGGHVEQFIRTSLILT